MLMLKRCCVKKKAAIDILIMYCVPVSTALVWFSPIFRTLEGKMGRIMVELPGIREPERVRKFLQGSANLEFWETFDSKEIVSLSSAD